MKKVGTNELVKVVQQDSMPLYFGPVINVNVNDYTSRDSKVILIIK